jgi:hypothetical protein
MHGKSLHLLKLKLDFNILGIRVKEVDLWASE